MITIEARKRHQAGRDLMVLLASKTQLRQLDLERNDRQYLTEQLDGDAPFAVCDISGRLVLVHLSKRQARGRQLEAARQAACMMAARLNGAKRSECQLLSLQDDPALTLAMVEGLCLGGYHFGKYKTSESKRPTLERITLVAPEVSAAALEGCLDLCEATCIARDLVNEPLSFLTATQLSAEIRNLSRTSGFKVQVLNKEQIEAMGMGGLMAVNRGSPDPPTFTVMEWKPKGAVNTEPVVLVGKGVVFDTGGLSLKPTPNSMDQMKCDMAGAAAVAGAMAAVARRQLPLHVIALVPATDNRPGGNAITPGDVIRMHNGLTVEVMNTDAEGRLILADAMSYAERYKPELVITVATLTGSAARAIGIHGSVAMGTADEKTFARLADAGDHVHERIARFPFWPEYESELDSDIADLKNLGGADAGAITAGKFLARFTSRPFVHIDIAGTAFLSRQDHYRPKGGTGVGVRLLCEFLERRARG